MRVGIGRLFRCGLLVALVAAVSVPLFAGTASAKGKPSVVTLTCERGVVATGTIQLQTEWGAGAASEVTPISCTSGQTFEVRIKPTSRTAGFFTYAMTTVMTANGTPGHCGPSSGERGGTPLVDVCLTGGPTLDVT